MIRLKSFIVLLTFLAFSGFAKAEYLREDDLTSLIYSCYLERDIPVFCSTQQIDDPHLKIYLPLFKSVMLDNKIHAFRIMATGRSTLALPCGPMMGRRFTATTVAWSG